MIQYLWCCVGKNFKGRYYDYTTLSYTRRDSIKKAVGGSETMNWDWHKENGWKCIKVTVTIEPR